MKANQLALAAMRVIGIDPPPDATDGTSDPASGQLESLRQATGWVNSPPLTPADLSGKVVLIDFWTYTCINWRRTLPYLRAWFEKYRDQGLVVIGVHSPEFAFERDVDNVRQATTQTRVDYPVAIDSDHVIWRAFNNEYWPALYLIDAHGRLRHHQFGEGEYVQSEMFIQKLLAESGVSDVTHQMVSVDGAGAEAAADWRELWSPENYLGYLRTDGFASPEGAVVDERRAYTPPARFGRNEWALTGEWRIGRQAVTLDRAGGRISYAFHARDLHLVMGPATHGTEVPFRVRVDGQPPGAAHGVDADDQGNGVVSEQRMYQLIRQPHPISDRLFEIEFLDAGVEAFVFTFG